jgi:hypothetical protein
MSSSSQQPCPPAQDYINAGWEAALTELRQEAAQLEARGAHRAAVTLYDAIRLIRARGPDRAESTSD